MNAKIIASNILKQSSNITVSFDVETAQLIVDALDRVHGLPVEQRDVLVDLKFDLIEKLKGQK